MASYAIVWHRRFSDRDEWGHWVRQPCYLRWPVLATDGSLSFAATRCDEAWPSPPLT